MLRNICPENNVCLEREVKITERNICARNKLLYSDGRHLFLQQTDKSAQDEPLVDCNLHNILNDRELHVL